MGGFQQSNNTSAAWEIGSSSPLSTDDPFQGPYQGILRERRLGDVLIALYSCKAPRIGASQLCVKVGRTTRRNRSRPSCYGQLATLDYSVGGDQMIPAR